MTESNIWMALGMIWIFLVAAYLVFKKLKSARYAAMLAIGTTGFSEIAFEITVVLAFQVIYGFVYYKLGLILTSFMAGLVFGSSYITRILEKLKDDFQTFMKIQIAIVIYPILLPPIFLILSKHSGGFSSWIGSNIIFPLLPIVAGVIGGLQFPLGAKIYLGKSKKAAEAGGMAYGIDLIGACIGAIAISSFLLPVLGVFKTCAAVSILNFSVLIFLAMARRAIKLQTHSGNA